MDGSLCSSINSTAGCGSPGVTATSAVLSHGEDVSYVLTVLEGFLSDLCVAWNQPSRAGRPVSTTGNIHPHPRHSGSEGIRGCFCSPGTHHPVNTMELGRGS